MELAGWELAALEGLVLAFLANIVIGVGLVLVTYRLMEIRIAAAIGGGLLLAVAIVVSQAVIGEQLFTLNFEERVSMIVAAGIGAVLSITGTMSLLRPELE